MIVGRHRTSAARCALQRVGLAPLPAATAVRCPWLPDPRPITLSAADSAPRRSAPLLTASMMALLISFAASEHSSGLAWVYKSHSSARTSSMMIFLSLMILIAFLLCAQLLLHQIS